tara:strand:- start:9240 stop:10184 length:945 start_codon:yes stop_codon:yes gene_type:complete
VKKVFITDYINNPEIERNILKDNLTLTQSNSIEVVLVWHKKIDKKFIDSMPKLKGIIRYGVGFDNIDVKYANSKDIYVCNTPDYGIDEVSDTALAMILNISRGITEYDYFSRTYTETWQENTNPRIKRTSEYNLGIIGAGRIGGSVLIKAKTIGFRTVFFDPYKPRGYEKMIGSKRLDNLNELLNICDIISVHTPLNNETKGMINKKFISEIKHGGSLINTARGKLLNNLDDLYKPLKSKKISSIGLDVLPNEPATDSKLVDAWRNREKWLNGRLIINPHTAYYSISAYKEMRTKAASNALRIISGLKPFNIID